LILVYPANFVAVDSIVFPVLHIELCSCPKLDEFRVQFIPFVDDIFINFSLIIHEKPLNIPDDLKYDFEDKLKFYILCLLLGG